MDIFKEKVAEQPHDTETTVPTDTQGITNEDSNVKDTNDEKSLDIWEGENKRKYGHDYFNIRNIVHEFPLKMQFGAIDKYIKEEIKNNNLRNDINTYADLIREIEDTIKTTKTETYTRIKRIYEYIQTLRKYNEAKRKKEEFLKLYKKD